MRCTVHVPLTHRESISARASCGRASLAGCPCGTLFLTQCGSTSRNAASIGDGIRTRWSSSVTASARADFPPRALADLVVEAASDKKAEDILVLNVSEVTTIADLFVICSARGERQAQGSRVERAVRGGLRVAHLRLQGQVRDRNCQWIDCTIFSNIFLRNIEPLF